MNDTICFEACSICGKERPLRHTVAMYEGEVVDEDKVLDWAGMPICDECNDELKRLEHLKLMSRYK